MLLEKLQMDVERGVLHAPPLLLLALSIHASLPKVSRRLLGHLLIGVQEP